MLTPDTRLMQWVQLIRAEYLEIPGLNLTQAQAQRLWGIDAVTAEEVLAALVDLRFLRRTHRDTYMRHDIG